MKRSEQIYLEAKAAERGLTATISYGPVTMDTEIITLTDGKKTYQFGITGMEMFQNEGEPMKDLIDWRIAEAMLVPRKPHFDSVSAPLSEMPQRSVR